jgi:hypothetical protein
MTAHYHIHRTGLVHLPDHAWDRFCNVQCTHEFELEDGKTLQGKFSGWARTPDHADRTTFIHWLVMLTGYGVKHPWNSRG